MPGTTTSSHAAEEDSHPGGVKNYIFFVEKIIGRRIAANGVTYYRVKWLNYPRRESTWEPIINLKSTCYLLLADYDRKNNNQKGMRSKNTKKVKAGLQSKSTRKGLKRIQTRTMQTQTVRRTIRFDAIGTTHEDDLISSRSRRAAMRSLRAELHDQATNVKPDHEVPQEPEMVKKSWCNIL